MATTQGVSATDDAMLSRISILNTHTKAPLTLAVPPGTRVADLKTAIAERCPGQPKPNGQRIIWKGRIVVDEEVVGDIWKPGEDTHTVHLAVHPSAWSSPPTIDESQPVPTSAAVPTPVTPSTFPTNLTGAFLPSPLLSTLTQPALGPLPTQYSIAKDYVMHHHTNALRVMAGQPLEPWAYPWGLDQASAAHWAYLGLTAAGHTFPTILMSIYPPHSVNERGLEYTFVNIDNRPYLSLLNPGASPTPMQDHAIQVLTSTLALVPYLDDLAPQLRLPIFQINPQHFTLPPRPNAQASAQRARRLAVAIRTLIPLSFTLLRASLFIVFFPQAREFLWLTVIIGVVLYEARLIINRANDAVPNIANPNDPNPNPNPAAGPAPNPNATTNPLSMNFQTLLDRATLSGIDSEAALLDLDVPELEFRPAPRDPSDDNKLREWAVRIKSFVLPLCVTLFPAAWARRREALRLREGRVKVVYGERANALRVEGEDGQEQIGMFGDRRLEVLREGTWRRSYVERVLDGIEEHVE